jgi:hypothetical protein
MHPHLPCRHCGARAACDQRAGQRWPDQQLGAQPVAPAQALLPPGVLSRADVPR